jgi:exodeoxyribonuclease III
MIVVSWNVAGRLKRQVEQAACVLAESPDVVCLQEVTKTSAPLWRDMFSHAGLPHVAFGDITARPDARRPLGAMTASREPLTEVPVPDLPWPERVVSVRVGDVEIVNVHSPVSPSPGLAKVLTHEAVFAHLAAASPHPRILCGDFNTPRSEKPDRTIWTFARTQHGKLRPDRGERIRRGSGRAGEAATGSTTWSSRRTSGSSGSSTATSGGASSACPTTRRWLPSST